MTFELPEHLSYSQVTTMLHCGEQWRLQRGLRLPNPPGWAMVGGHAVHEATEIIDGLDEPPDNIREIFEDCFRRETESQLARYVDDDGNQLYTKADFHCSGRASKAYPNKEDEKWWLENGPSFVASWVNFRRISPMTIYAHEGVPAVELEAEVEIANMPVKVIIDRVMSSSSGLVIVDLKSGSNMPKDAMQLGVYSQALWQSHGLMVRWGQFFDARKGITTPPVDLFKEWPKARLDYVFGGVRKMQTEGIFIAHPSNMCSACGVRDYCTAVGGRLAHTVEQPWDSN